jgi:hypothetical protein
MAILTYDKPIKCFKIQMKRTIKCVVAVGATHFCSLGHLFSAKITKHKTPFIYITMYLVLICKVRHLLAKSLTATLSCLFTSLSYYKKRTLPNKLLRGTFEMQK